jgi:hypothetical protein
VVEPPELAEALAALVRAFEVRFGRPPGPDDPIFFDPDADTPTPIGPERFHDLTGAAAAAGGDPAEICAVAHHATANGHGTGRETGPGDADPRHAELQREACREAGGDGLTALEHLPKARMALRPVLIASTQTMLAEPRALRTVGPLIEPARDVVLPDEQARLNELVAAQLVEWLLLARDRYPASQRHRAAERGLAFASHLPSEDRAAAHDLLGLLGVGPRIPVSRLASHADGAAILGLWALVCGLVDTLGGGDTDLLRRLTLDPEDA